MPVDRTKLRGAYARLKGLDRATSRRKNYDGSIARNFNSIANELGSNLEEDISPFIIGSSGFFRSGDSEYCDGEILRSKLLQFINYLEYVHHVGSEIIEIGSLYNSIRDDVLKSRCSDLLSAPGDFDRAINQATQVLEDRIRTRSGADNSLAGAQLVNQVLKADINETTLKVSNVASEHAGICDICRGIMQSFRNPTHHQITDRFMREDALKLVAFVDDLIRIIDDAEMVRH